MVGFGCIIIISKEMKRIFYILPLLLLVAFSSCKDDVELLDISFSGQLEQPVSSDSTKNYLSMERYVYWNSGDKVWVFSGEDNYSEPVSSREAVAEPVPGNPQAATIDLFGFAYNDVYYGIYPSICKVDDNPKQINMPTSYDYNRTSNPVNPDLTFPGPGIPMVAYHKMGTTTSHSDVPHLDFHSVVGVARIQIANNSGSSQTISHVEFAQRSGSNPISGVFTVNNITKYDPYLSDPVTTTGTSITISNIDKTLGNGEILTLYLPLPAITSNHGTSSTQPNYADYSLDMTVYSDASTQVFEKAFTVKIRRNTLSYLPALVVNGWNPVSISRGLVGHGTALRPFQIYSAADLVKVRNAFNAVVGTSNAPVINGIEVDENTYFRIVHNFDLMNTSGTAVSEKWDAGIKGFKGHLIYQVGQAAGSINSNTISNNTGYPVFESISEGGEVDGLTVEATVQTSPAGATFSPLCKENSGTMKNCRFMGTLTTSNNTNLAGVCATNRGTLENCSNIGTINAQRQNGKAAGICYENFGTIQGFDISTGMVVSNAGSAASICYINETDGHVINSQSTLAYGVSAPINYSFGGLVYTNKGTIQNCEVLGQLYSSKSVGGICHTNEGGVVDRCRVSTSILRGAGSLNEYIGGIAAIQQIGTSVIRNCFNNAEPTANIQAVAGVAGGIVGDLQNGHVENCYTNFEVAYPTSKGYGAIVGNATGGTIENCYSGRDLAPFCYFSYQTQISVNCFATPNSVTSSTTNCCTYRYSDGEILSLTASSQVIDQGVQTGDNIGKALNAWVNSKNGQSGTTYLRWTEVGRPTFTNSPATSKRTRR